MSHSSLHIVYIFKCLLSETKKKINKLFVRKEYIPIFYCIKISYSKFWLVQFRPSFGSSQINP